MTFPKRHSAGFFIFVAVMTVCNAGIVSAETELHPYRLVIGDSFENINRALQEIETQGWSDKDVQVCQNAGKWAIVDNVRHERRMDALTQKENLRNLGKYSGVEFNEAKINSFNCFSVQALKRKETSKETSSAPILPKAVPKKLPVRAELTQKVVSPKKNAKQKIETTAKQKHISEQYVVTVHDDIEVLPEVKSLIVLSNRFTNVFECPNGLDIMDITYSEERPIKTARKGSVGYVKFQVAEDKSIGKKYYTSEEAEFYIICGNNDYRYKIIAFPKDVSAKSVKLKAIGERAEKNTALFQGMAFEQKIEKIMRQAARHATSGGESFPDSFTIKPQHEQVYFDHPELGRVYLNSQRRIEIDGEGLALREFNVVVDDRALRRIKEKHFLNKAVSEQPLAIMLIPSDSGRQRRLTAYVLENKD